MQINYEIASYHFTDNVTESEEDYPGLRYVLSTILRTDAEVVVSASQLADHLVDTNTPQHQTDIITQGRQNIMKNISEATLSARVPFSQTRRATCMSPSPTMCYHLNMTRKI